MTYRDAAAASIKRAEGYSEYPYRCTADHFTVGHGINIHSMPIPPHVSTCGQLLEWLSDPVRHESWFQRRLTEAERGAKVFAGDAWESLSEARRAVLVDLAYWLGYPRLSGFVDFRAAVQAGHWVKAEAALLDSLLARQVPGRTQTLASRFLDG